MTNNNAELVLVPREVLERVVHTLEFYAKPFGRLDEYEEPVRVPDFYSEMQFGDLAAETLGSLADLPKTPRPLDELREAAEAFRMLFVTDSEPPALIVPEQFQPDGSEDFTDAFARLDMALREFGAAAPSVSGEEELRKPDFVYDPANWDCTYEWGDRDLVHGEGEGIEPNEVMPVGTLFHGPKKYVAHVAVTRDEAGDPDEMEYRWFNSEEEARAALSPPNLPEGEK